MGVRVECHSGSRNDEEPRALWLGGGRHEVMLVLDRWLEPGARCFRVQTYDGRTWDLRQDEGNDVWRVRQLRPAGG